MIDEILTLIQNGQPKVYPGWTVDQIVCRVAEAMRIRCLGIAHNSAGRVTGVAICKPLNECLIEIECVVCTEPKALKELLRQLAVFYPNHNVVANRQGKRKQYKKRLQRKFYGRIYTTANSRAVGRNHANPDKGFATVHTRT